MKKCDLTLFLAELFCQHETSYRRPTRVFDNLIASYYRNQEKQCDPLNVWDIPCQRFTKSRNKTATVEIVKKIRSKLILSYIYNSLDHPKRLQETFNIA